MTQFWEWYSFTLVYGWVVYLIGRKDGIQHASSQKDESR